MRFNPKSKEVLEKSLFGSLAEGVADFKVIQAFEKDSKNSGNPMIELTLEVTDCNGETRKLKDWLTHSSDAGLYKTQQFCKSISCIQLYEDGSIPPSYLHDRMGRCFLKKRKGDDGIERMSIKEYLAEEDHAETVPFDDDIPFK